MSNHISGMLNHISLWFNRIIVVIALSRVSLIQCSQVAYRLVQCYVGVCMIIFPTNRFLK